MSCEMPEAFSQKERFARKDHRCCECVEVIPKGTLYLYSSGVWDGQGRSYKTCSPCAAVRQEALTHEAADMPECGPAFGALAEWLQDMFELPAGLKSEIIKAGGKLLGWAVEEQNTERKG